MTTPKRVSLAEMSRKTGSVLARDKGDGIDEAAPPTMRDITECLYFSPGDGRIWLNNERMLLLHASSLSALRRELLSLLGNSRSRGLFTRIGYISGVRDARLVKEQWPNAEPMSIFTAGARLHSLEGIVKVEPLVLQFDAEHGVYQGEFLWHHSTEAEEHVAALGLATEPVCWMQVGYAIGYVSTLFGKLVIFRELECTGMGHAACRVVGKAVEQWIKDGEDVAEDISYLNAESFVTSGGAKSEPLQAEPLPEPDGGKRDPDQRYMVGVSAAFSACCHRLRRAAPTRATVLFVGESGVGKELFAHMLHDISPRKDMPFVSINCAAIPDTLVEAELFGVEKGAYTGAVQSRAGRFERADGGTLFLDEISSLSLIAQGKLLRALQEGESERVGGTRVIKTDVRVIAASNVDLREEVRAGRFREDLFFRLNVYPIHIPPLRERRDDIPLLLNYFLQGYNARHGRKAKGFSSRAVRALLNYDYPGNIRELQNLVERGVIAVDDGETIDLPHLFVSGESVPTALFAVTAAGRLAEEAPVEPEEASKDLFQRIASLVGNGKQIAIDDLDQTLMDLALERSHGKLSGAARLLGLTRPQLAYRLKKREQREV